MMDAKARLEEIRDKLLERTRAKLEIDYSGRGVLTVNDVMQILLEAGVTLPPQPAGPMKPAEAVTSEEAVVAYEVAYNARRGGFLWFDPIWRIDGRHCFDSAMPLLARDHGLLTPAEVERRAREWRDGRNYAWSDSAFADLIAALTASADTSAASTREAK